MRDELFPLGAVMFTRGITEAIETKGARPEVMAVLLMHHAGDWGVLSDEDKWVNDRAVVDGERLLSAFDTTFGRVWVITEADRSVTTVLFPDEY